MSENKEKTLDIEETITKPKTKPRTKTTRAKAPLTFKQKLAKEKKVKVRGSRAFQSTLGKYYTFLYNGVSVHINFDGKDYEYPETIAKVLTRKLEEIANANTPKEINEKIS